jgi:diketogulonate reductase-like aldo/keto reductase
VDGEHKEGLKMNDDDVFEFILKKPFLYGTAWKEAETTRLTRLAIEQGFRGIDTANQRKHYFEAGVGDAIKSAFRDDLVTRAELFLQTKFTFQAGQDHRLPYDPSVPVAEQVQQSFACSLEHLGVDYLDSFVLHGPSRGAGLSAVDWEAWYAIEQLHLSGRVRRIGVSNVSLEQLRTLTSKARVKPVFVQNRCYAIQAWGREVRDFCQANGMVYQAFSLLTANTKYLSDPRILAIATKHQRSVSQVVFRFAIESGMIPLTGTTKVEHMQEDLRALDFRLGVEELRTIESVAS